MKPGFVTAFALFLAGCATGGGGGGVQPAPAGASGEALALVAQAQMRLENGEISEGLQLFSRAVAAAPADRELREEYGLALVGVGLNDAAIEQLRKAAPLTPSGEAALGIMLAQAATERPALEAAILHLEAGLTAPQEGMQARLTLVQTELRLGRGEDAWRDVQPLLGERPNDPRLLLLAGQALRQSGRHDEAVDYLKRAAEHPEVRPRATVELVEALAAAGKYRDAADVMGQLVRSEGTTMAALTRWATLLLRAGDRERAIGVLDDILAKDPTARDAVLLRAMLAASGGDVSTAEQLYRRALANDPQDPDAALGLARLLVEVRRMDEARTLLDGVWGRVVEAKLEREEAGVEVAQERAALELIDDKPEAALEWLHRLEGAGASRRTLALWAAYFRARKASREGAEFFSTVKPGSDPGADRARAALEAEFRLAIGDEERARELLAPLLAGSEDEVLAALGTLEREKRYTEVVAESRKALDRLDDSRALRFALAASLERSGAWDEAVATFREIIAKYPDDAPSLNYLGYMFADRNVKLEEARDMLIKAVKLDPTSGAYIDSLGWVYFRLGEYELAEKYLTEAVRLAGSDATVNEHLGDLYRAVNDLERAGAAYRRALECEADEEGQLDRIRQKMQALKVDVP